MHILAYASTLNNLKKKRLMSNYEKLIRIWNCVLKKPHFAHLSPCSFIGKNLKPCIISIVSFQLLQASLVNDNSSTGINEKVCCIMSLPRTEVIASNVIHQYMQITVKNSTIFLLSLYLVMSLIVSHNTSFSFSFRHCN